MSRRPKLRPLPEPERRQMLEQFMRVLDQHPDLGPLRAAAPEGPERQLALFAALERAAFRGSPAVAPPSHDDPLDQLLCDILEAIDLHPELKNHGSYYGTDRHLANLQALGAWGRNSCLPQKQASEAGAGREECLPHSAIELFTTAFSHLSANAATTLPALSTNNSPAPQGFSSNGELIVPSAASNADLAVRERSSQVVDATIVATEDSGQVDCSVSAEPRGIIHHATEKPGEQFEEAPIEARRIPARCVRRGRPMLLDDVAKGRLLGLMSHGLSFRQAAAQLGVHHVTILNLLKRDEEFAQQVSEARLDAISQPLLTVVQASRTNWRAAAWLAKFLEGRRASSYESTPEERELKRKRG